MKNLLDGYLKFRTEAFPEWKDHFDSLAERQAPNVLLITCSDSRIVPNLIFQSEPGEIFICRNAGNIIPPAGEMAGEPSATIEYAVAVLQVEHAIVCGHSDCGAVGAVLNEKDLSALPLVDRWLRYVRDARRFETADTPSSDPKARHKSLTLANVISQLKNLDSQPAVAAAKARGALRTHGWYYDIRTGVIEGYSADQGRFVPLEEVPAEELTIRG